MSQSRVAINFDSRTGSTNVRVFEEDEYVKTLRLGVRDLRYVYDYVADLRDQNVVVQVLIDEFLTDV